MMGMEKGVGGRNSTTSRKRNTKRIKIREKRKKENRTLEGDELHSFQDSERRNRERRLFSLVFYGGQWIRRGSVVGVRGGKEEAKKNMARRWGKREK